MRIGVSWIPLRVFKNVALNDLQEIEHNSSPMLIGTDYKSKNASERVFVDESSNSIHHGKCLTDIEIVMPDMFSILNRIVITWIRFFERFNGNNFSCCRTGKGIRDVAVSISNS